MKTIIAELKDPNRDCNNFDPGSGEIKPRQKAKICLEGKRARELFEALDEDGNGSLTEDEFVEGQSCKVDSSKILGEDCEYWIHDFVNIFGVNAQSSLQLC